MSQELVVVSAFFANGVFYSPGQVVRSDDPVVKNREALFSRSGEIEQATAAPGEKRSVRRPTRKS